MEINYNRIHLAAAFSTILVLKVFGQNSTWQHSLSVSPTISIMTIESNNTGFDFVYEPDKMPYGVFPKYFVLAGSTLQWAWNLNYVLSHSSGIVFSGGLNGLYSVAPGANGGSFSEDFQFYNFKLAIGYDVLPKQPDEDLLISFGGGVCFNRNVNRFVYDGLTPPFTDLGAEKFVRKGTSFIWSGSLRWVDYFSTHWGYSVFAEYSATRVEPSKMTMTEFHVNGVDELNTLTTRQKEYEFGDVAGDEPTNKNKPKILPKEYYEYAFFTIGVGVHYRF